MVNRALSLMFLCALPGVLRAQYVDPQAYDDPNDPQRMRPMVVRQDPIITVVELRGPLPAVEFQDMFKLSDTQTAEYRAALDSFNLLTKADRDLANKRVEQLGQAIMKRDSAAAEYYHDQLKGLGKELKARQVRWDDRVKKLLTKEQQKAYKDYRKKQDEEVRNPPEQKKRPG